MDQKTKVLLAAFFHDIGKFQQRGIPLNEREGIRHQVYSAGFVNKVFKDELLATLTLNHHSDEIIKNKLSGETKILAELICEADNLASGERVSDKTVTKQQPFESIFTKISKRPSNSNIFKEYKKEFFQPISQLVHQNYIPPEETKLDSEQLESSYKKWWDKFYYELFSNDEKTKVSISEIETLINLSKKYLWCVPSSSYKTRSDVSLFEHSKITAVIAVSMFDFLFDKYKTIGSISDINNRNEDRYLLILADITGIQKYIYNIGHKGASKALKGRSFYLQQMLDNIAYWILDKKLNLPITNLIYSSGGKFCILAPNTDSINSRIEEIQKELEQKFLEEYEGDLGVIIGKLPLSGLDLQYDNTNKKHLISEKWDKLNKIVEQNKRHKFSNNWDYSFFKPMGVDGDVERCAATGKELIKKADLLKINPEEVSISGNIKFLKYANDKTLLYEIIDNDGKPTGDYISNEQYISQKIGTALKNPQNTVVVTDQINDYAVLNLNSFAIQKEHEYENKYDSKSIRHFLINDLDITKLKGDSNKGFKFYGGDWRLPKTYEDVIENGVGIERLGVLRLDVDNLGLIFKEGLGSKATFGRVVQLSSMLDFFFSCYLNKLSTLYWTVTDGIVEKEKTRTDGTLKVKDLIEIVYSGGDDVFIVGHWSILPDVALWINNEFKRYTCNNSNFSVSAGIYLFDDKYPLYKAALEAGEFESSAKKKERKNRDKNLQTKKNGICFLDKDTPVSWSDFENIRNHVKTFYEWLEIGKPNDDGELKKISKGLIARLYSIYEEYRIGKYQNWAKWRWRAAYSLNRLGRQYKQYQKEIESFSAELFTSNNTEQELIQLLYIIANWTDLLTRKKENK